MARPEWRVPNGASRMARPEWRVPNGASVAGDIGIAQHIGFQLNLFQAVLHHVSDRDDADQAAVFHDGKMADAAAGLLA